MKAVRFHEFGDPGVLRLDDVEIPRPGPGQVRLRVAATTFSPVDDGIRGGYLREVFPVALPHTPGVDVSGTVDALGDGVEGWAIGDAVVGFLPMTAVGAAAEYVLAPREILAKAPTSIPLADAAALPSVGLTARQMILDVAALESGGRVLVVGAGGAVGGYAVQLAARVGAHVVATASARSRARVAAAGADEIVDHTTTRVSATVTEKVDALLLLAPPDPAELTALVGLVRDGGVVVSALPALAVPADEARGVRVETVFVRSDAARLAELVAQVDAGELHVEVAERVPLADLATVHARAGKGELSGKVVVVP